MPQTCWKTLVPLQTHGISRDLTAANNFIITTLFSKQTFGYVSFAVCFCFPEGHLSFLYLLLVFNITPSRQFFSLLSHHVSMCLLCTFPPAPIIHLYALSVSSICPDCRQSSHSLASWILIIHYRYLTWAIMADFSSQRSLYAPTVCVFMLVWQLLSLNRESSPKLWMIFSLI